MTCYYFFFFKFVSTNLSEWPIFWYFASIAWHWTNISPNQQYEHDLIFSLYIYIVSMELLFAVCALNASAFDCDCYLSSDLFLHTYPVYVNHLLYGLWASDSMLCNTNVEVGHQLICCYYCCSHAFWSVFPRLMEVLFGQLNFLISFVPDCVKLCCLPEMTYISSLLSTLRLNFCFKSSSNISWFPHFLTFHISWDMCSVSLIQSLL